MKKNYYGAVRLGLSLGLLSVVVTGCFDKSDDFTGLVKDSVYEGNRSMTIGNAFDSWSACSDTHWKSITTERGVRAVEYECELVGDKGERNRLLEIIESKINKEGGKEEFNNSVSAQIMMSSFSQAFIYNSSEQSKLQEKIQSGGKFSVDYYIDLLSFEKHSLVYQFSINVDDTFNFAYAGINFYYPQRPTLEHGLAFEEASEYQKIFNDEPFELSANDLDSIFAEYAIIMPSE